MKSNIVSVESIYIFLSSMFANALLCLPLLLAIKVEKKAGEQIVYTKMKVKELKTLLGKNWSFLFVSLLVSVY